MILRTREPSKKPLPTMDELLEAIVEAKYSDLIGFIVQIAEALSVVDRVSAAVVHLDPEQLEVLDRVLRASEAVIADLAFRSTPLDAEGAIGGKKGEACATSYVGVVAVGGRSAHEVLS